MAKAKKIDRRVQRTRQLLQDALMAMMIEKGYEATTVQDIIDRANLGRATFYAHFADKETLLASRLEDLRAMLALRQQAGGVLGFSLAMFEHARGHLSLYAAIVAKESGAFVLQRIHRTIADLAGLDLKAMAFRGTAEERDVGDSVAIRHRRCDADCAKASVGSQRVLHRCTQRDLRLGHRRALTLCGGVVFAFSNRLGLDDCTAVGIDNHLEELSTRRRIDGEL